MNDSEGRQTRLTTQEGAVEALGLALDELARAVEARLVSLGGGADLLTGIPNPTPVDQALAVLRGRPTPDVRLGLLGLQVVEIERWLDALGFDGVRTAYLGRIEELEDAVESHLKQLGLPGVTSALDAEGVRLAVQALAVSQMDKTITPIRLDMSIRIHDAMIANAQLLTDREFAERIADAAEGATPAALTRARDRFAEADRFIAEEAVAEVEDETGEPYLRAYSGPSDSRKRPFCRVCLNKAFTVEMVSRLRNGHGTEALLDGGGPNCRDQWIAVSPDEIEDYGVELATDADVAEANAAAQSARKKRRRRR